MSEPAARSSSSAAAWPAPRPPRRCASEGYDGPITLLGRRAAAARTSGRRCPRTTSPGKAESDKAVVHRDDWYAEHDVDLRRGADGRPRIDRGRARGRAGRRRPGRRTTSSLLATGSDAAHAAACPAPTLDGVTALRTLEDSDRIQADASAPASGSSSSAPAGSGWRSPRPRARPAPTSRSLESGRAAAAAACSAPRWRPSSPTCTASTASTCASACRSPRSPATAGVTGVRLDDGSTVEADAVMVGVGVHARAPSWPRRPASTSTTASWSTSRCARATRHLRRRRHRQRTTTRCSAGRSASSTGPTRSTSRRPPPQAMLGGDDVVRPAAVLLHRPVRPRHGVHRLRAAGRLRPGRGPRRRRASASSSRSGSTATTASWPAMNVNVWDVPDQVEAADRRPRRSSTRTSSPTRTSRSARSRNRSLPARLVPGPTSAVRVAPSGASSAHVGLRVAARRALVDDRDRDAELARARRTNRRPDITVSDEPRTSSGSRRSTSAKQRCDPVPRHGLAEEHDVRLEQVLAADQAADHHERRRAARRRSSASPSGLTSSTRGAEVGLAARSRSSSAARERDVPQVRQTTGPGRRAARRRRARRRPGAARPRSA